MPFRDREWEDFQRDCDFFPAYTDYIFGVDTRPEVDDEPGLHPQILDTQLQMQHLPQVPPQRLYGLPPPVLYHAAYDPSRGGGPALTSFSSIYGAPANSWLALQRTSSKPMLRQESSLESMQPTPTPMPRQLPAFTPQCQLHRHGMPEPPMLRQESSLNSMQPTLIPAPSQFLFPNQRYPQNLQPHTYATPGLPVLRQESSLESMQPTPTPAPRQLPASAPQFQPHPHTMPRPPMLRQDSSMAASLPPTPYPAPHNSPVSGSQPHALTMPDPSRTAMPRQDSPMGASQPQTQPSSRTQPIAGLVDLLRPDDIIKNPLFLVLPQDRCMEINKLITQAWSIVNSDTTPQQKAPAMDYIRKMSLGVAEKIDQYKAATAELESILG